MLLPDINVWLALSFEVHYHHAAASAWFDKQDDGSCSFCRATQSGFLRLSTNPSVFKNEALTLSAAWNCYDELLQDPRTEFTGEPLGLEHAWRRFSMGNSFSPKIWNDAYLAAFAYSGNYKLVTFDGGFKQYSGIELVLLREKGKP
jgi:uncharacterized protein